MSSYYKYNNITGIYINYMLISTESSGSLFLCDIRITFCQVNFCWLSCTRVGVEKPGNNLLSRSIIRTVCYRFQYFLLQFAGSSEVCCRGVSGTFRGKAFFTGNLIYESAYSLGFIQRKKVPFFAVFSFFYRSSSIRFFVFYKINSRLLQTSLPASTHRCLLFLQSGRVVSTIRKFTL